MPPPLPPPSESIYHRPAALSWFTVLLIAGMTVSTVAGSFLVFVLYLRPVLKAAERATKAAETAAVEMEVAAKVRGGAAGVDTHVICGLQLFGRVCH